MLKNVKIAETKPKLLAFNCLLLPWPSLTCMTLLCSLHVNKGSSLLEFLASKNYTVQHLLLRSFSRFRDLQELKVFTAGVVFTKMQQGLTTMQRLCVFIYYHFLQISLFVDVCKKQASEKNNQSTELWVATHR